MSTTDTSKLAASLTSEAYHRIRADVLACRLQPGERIRINELCEQYEFSLGAVREALSRLVAESLVVAEPQKGFRVAPISLAELKDLTDMRVEVEAECLRRSIQHGDVAWESRLVAVYHQLSKTPERAKGDVQRLNDAWGDLHSDFHETLVSACDSEWRLRIRRILYAQAERYRQYSVPLAKKTRDLSKEHREIMEAAIGRDSRRAVRLLSEHIEETTRILLKASTLREKA